MKRYILLRLLAIQLAIIIAMLAAGLAAARGTGRDEVVWIAAVVAAAVAGVVSYLIARITVRPVSDLTAAFRRFSAGDFDVRVLLAKSGRLRNLGDDFNKMAFSTKALVAELRQQREALDAIVRSIQEGLAVIDDSGRLVLVNSSFRKLTGEPKVEGRYYWEVVREPDFVEFIRSAAPDKPTAVRQLDIAGRYFACSASYLSAARRVVLTCHDITEVAQAARMKRDFVQNVSHELRTPLTAIKGFAETIEVTVDKDNRQHLDAIVRNTDRLVSLVQDLLALSELEERGAELQLEDFDLKEVAEQMLKLFGTAAQAKELELRLSSTDAGGPVRADRFKLEQVFTNLLDNAVKYTEKGTVEVVLTRESGGERDAPGAARAVIEIRDTGPGIPAEHLPRIFERFYVVDKGRSRQLGGTGLGLSIVKHVVLLHGGDVSVRSTPGAGTTFTVTIPVKPL